MDPNEKKKWTTYTSEQTFRDTKRISIDFDKSMPEMTEIALEVMLGIAPQLHYLLREADSRGLSIRDLFRNHVKLHLKENIEG